MPTLFVGALIPAGHVAVQCTYFEKSVDKNWLVPIHQDLSIPVRERGDRPALCGWSENEGALHTSSKAPGTCRRRVLHVVSGPPALPYGLRWQHAVG